MKSHELDFCDDGSSLTMQPQLGLAVIALEAATPAEALLAFEEAVAVFAQRPNARNAQKVELTMRAVRHHAEAAESLVPERAVGP